MLTHVLVSKSYHLQLQLLSMNNDIRYPQAIHHDTHIYRGGGGAADMS